MFFEVAGFLSGVASIGAALWLLHRRDSERVMRGIHGINGIRGGRQRA
ncbi:hypothetical protein [Aestuariivirga sp.]